MYQEGSALVVSHSNDVLPLLQTKLYCDPLKGRCNVRISNSEVLSIFSTSLGQNCISCSAFCETPTPMKMTFSILTLRSCPIAYITCAASMRVVLELTSSPSVRITWTKFHVLACPVSCRNWYKFMSMVHPFITASRNAVEPLGFIFKRVCGILVSDAIWNPNCQRTYPATTALIWEVVAPYITNQLIFYQWAYNIKRLSYF